MRNLTKSILCAGLAGIISFVPCSCLTRGSKEWIDDAVKQGIVQHEQKSIKQLAEAFHSTYRVVNEAFYETREGNIISPGRISGASMLFEGGYLLTAKPVVGEDFPWQHSDYYWGRVVYHHNELSLSDKGSSYGLEMILAGQDFDYALLKVKEGKDLAFYNPGLNFPDKVELGMQSAAIGCPLGTKRDVRFGNVSQVDSTAGEGYLTFKNDVIKNDLGGPLFVIENGDIKLTAITTRFSMQGGISYGLRISRMIKDMEERLESGSLDKKTAEEVRNFLKLNKI